MAAALHARQMERRRLAEKPDSQDDSRSQVRSKQHINKISAAILLLVTHMTSLELPACNVCFNDGLV